MTDTLIEAVARAIDRDVHGDLNAVPLYQVARAALKAIENSGHLVVPAWKPIETAPRDGSVLLGYCPEGVTSGDYPTEWAEQTHHVVMIRWHQKEEGWSTPLIYIDSGVWDDPSFDCGSVYGNPTHWMPLPSPPDREVK